MQPLERSIDLPVSFFEKLVQASIDGMIVLDNDMHVMIWNDQAAIITGIAAASAIGKAIVALQPEINTNGSVSKALLHAKRGFASFVPANENISTVSKYESHYIPISEEGKTIGILHLLHDVSHRIRTEEELKRLNQSLLQKNQELKKKNALLQALFHITAHDLKEPMRRIYTAIEILLNSEVKRFSNSGKLHFRQIQGALQRIGFLADDILSLSQDAESITQLSDINLNELLQVAIKRIDKNIRSKEAKVTSGVLPVYHGHPTMLMQLIQQLLLLSLQYLKQPGGEVHVDGRIIEGDRIQHPQADARSAYLRLYIGIDAEDIEPAEAVDANVSAAASNDLDLCSKIVALHEGFTTTSLKKNNTHAFHCYLRIGS